MYLAPVRRHTCRPLPRLERLLVGGEVGPSAAAAAAPALGTNCATLAAPAPLPLMRPNGMLKEAAKRDGLLGSSSAPST